MVLGKPCQPQALVTFPESPAGALFDQPRQGRHDLGIALDPVHRFLVLQRYVGEPAPKHAVLGLQFLSPAAFEAQRVV